MIGHPLRLAATLAACLACAADGGTAPPPVRVAVALPPPWGPEAMRLAVSDLQEELLQAGIEVIGDSTYGEGQDADRDVATAERLARDSTVIAVIGHGGSRPSLAVAPVYAEAGIAQIVPTGTSRLLRGAGEWLLPLAPSDSVEGAFIVRYVASELGARRAMLFYVNDEYGIGLRDGITAECHARGIEILETVSVGLRGDFDLLLEAALQRGRPDVVIVAARPIATGAIARGLARRGLPTPVVAGDGALILPELAERAGPAVDRIHAVAFWTPGRDAAASRAFETRFRALIGTEPHASHAMSYDAIRVVLDAVLAGARTGDAVRTSLRGLGTRAPPHDGVTGPVTFQPGRPANLVMVRIVGGRAVPVGARP